MKRPVITMLTLMLTIFMVSNANSQRDEVSVTLADAGASVSYPLSVMAVINNKCYGCHSPEGRSDDAKEALQWIHLQDMEAIDVMAVMDEIVEVLEEGKMPPEKMVAKYPEMKLSDEEATKLREWAEGTLAKFDE